MKRGGAGYVEAAAATGTPQDGQPTPAQLSFHYLLFCPTALAERWWWSLVPPPPPPPGLSASSPTWTKKLWEVSSSPLSPPHWYNSSVALLSEEEEKGGAKEKRREIVFFMARIRKDRGRMNRRGRGILSCTGHVPFFYPLYYYKIV